MDTDELIEAYAEASELKAKEKVKALCMERCDQIVCSGYEFPEGVNRAHWVGMGLITLAAGVFAWSGYLL